MLRRLDLDQIRDSGFRIHPIIRHHLRCAAERHQHAVRHVAFAEAEFLRAGAIDFDVQLRHVRHLVQINVDRTGNLLHARFDLARDFVVLRRVASDLDVDRRRHTEIQDLADDVGRLKIEPQIRKTLCEFFAHVSM